MNMIMNNQQKNKEPKKKINNKISLHYEDYYRLNKIKFKTNFKI